MAAFGCAELTDAVNQRRGHFSCFSRATRASALTLTASGDHWNAGTQTAALRPITGAILGNILSITEGEDAWYLNPPG